VGGGISRNANGTDQDTLLITNENPTGYGNKSAADRADGRSDETGLLLGPRHQTPGSDSEVECFMGLSEGYFETLHRSAVLALSGHDMPTTVKNDNGQRIETLTMTTRPGGGDQGTSSSEIQHHKFSPVGIGLIELSAMLR
jgi:hypothetical protein